MRIAIDARFYGTENTGLGRYTNNILKNFFSPSDSNTYILFVTSKYKHLTFPGDVKVVPIKVKHYTILEQLVLPILCIRYKVDLLYTLHFNAPVFSPIPLVVTIHDLIKSFYTDISTSTHGKLVFKLKRLGYQMVMKSILYRAQKIIVPTLAVKNNIIQLFPKLSQGKIFPIHEAVDSIFSASRPTPKITHHNKIPLLFVGNAYPHKNLKTLLQAFSLLRREDKYYLTLLSKKTPFLNSCLSALDHSVRQYITIKQALSDEALLREYESAHLLITPSLMEGFGLPGLEALSTGTPVVASDIAVYHEVYQDNVTYFDPTSPTSLVQAIKNALNTDKDVRYHSSRTWAQVAKDVRKVLL